jgi:hypothetical protein
MYSCAARVGESASRVRRARRIEASREFGRENGIGENAAREGRCGRVEGTGSTQSRPAAFPSRFGDSSPRDREVDFAQLPFPVRPHAPSPRCRKPRNGPWQGLRAPTRSPRGPGRSARAALRRRARPHGLGQRRRLHQLPDDRECAARARAALEHRRARPDLYASTLDAARHARPRHQRRDLLHGPRDLPGSSRSARSSCWLCDWRRMRARGSSC